MKLKPGTRLRSQVDTTEVIVVRAPEIELELQCGGHPMIGTGETPEPGITAETEMTPAVLGKRYTAEQDDLMEILVTKAGGAGLSANGRELVLRTAKPLPASD